MGRRLIDRLSPGGVDARTERRAERDRRARRGALRPTAEVRQPIDAREANHGELVTILDAAGIDHVDLDDVRVSRRQVAIAATDRAAFLDAFATHARKGLVLAGPASAGNARWIKGRRRVSALRSRRLLASSPSFAVWRETVTTGKQKRYGRSRATLISLWGRSTATATPAISGSITHRGKRVIPVGDSVDDGSVIEALRQSVSSSDEGSSENEPLFSLVCAVFDVARFLPDFIRSIEAQTCRPALLEVIMVDDGSTDESLQLCEEWASRRPDLVRVLAKENGGQGSARNLGMTIARGTWLTFIDPDDWVNPPYFEIVERFAADHPDVTMLATNRLLYLEDQDLISDKHPLKRMFKKDQLVELGDSPECFQGSAPAAFVRRDIVLEHGLRFDTRIRPNFEDGHFCAKYLLLTESPSIGFLRSALYYYRKRADNSSTLASSVTQPGRFREVPEHGYLDVLRFARLQFGHVPHWLQNMILYELSWYFSSEDKHADTASAANGDLGLEFIDKLREIARYLDPVIVESFSLRPYKPEWRDIFLHQLQSDEPWHTDYVVLQQYDEAQQRVRVSFRFTGVPPDIDYRMGDSPIEPAHQKIRSLDYFGHPLLYEKMAWLPHTGTLSIRLNGQPVDLRNSWKSDRKVTSMMPARVRAEFADLTEGGGTVQGAPSTTARRGTQSKIDTDVRGGLVPAAIRFAAQRMPYRSRFENAWVLMDRIHDSNDSAEELFHYLRANRPDINAWFTVAQDTEDWRRLERSGTDHVVAHGSLAWKVLMLNCDELISSHADVPVMSPREILNGEPAPWHFTFLQHGVIKDDLSKWLNSKRIRTLVTSTDGEYHSFVDDYTPYVFSTREVQLTGLPRFDALHRAAQRVDERDTIIIAPTWRSWLNKVVDPHSQERTVAEDFARSEFAQKWRELLHSARLAEIVEAANLRVVFLPHPNLVSAIDQFELPASFEVASYSDPTIHEAYARAITLLTDFSSTAFNAAFLNRQPIYYFFDHDRVMAGGHVGRKGYFEYERDGFGPLLDQTDAVLDEIEFLIKRGGVPRDPYAGRIERAFEVADGRCSERVTHAIEAARQAT